MSAPPAEDRHPEDGFLDRDELARLQDDRLQRLLAEVLPQNPFYARKFASAGVEAREVHTAADLSRLPFTTKAELVNDQRAHPPYGSILTYPLGRYARLHQTSGTSAGGPLRWLDTPESWSWLLGCWETIFRVCNVRPEDRLFFAFSFGPFLGFWTAFDAANQRGFLSLAGGGMSTTARIRFLLDNEVTGVFATPTYALHMAEVAQQEGIDLAKSNVRFLIVAGEPGGSILSTRLRIEQAWGARVFDHSGMTEVGVFGIECPENPAGLHVLEAEYLAEVLDPASRQLVPAGEPGELVLTGLGRCGSPLIRYRTGDLVKMDVNPCRCGRSFMRLDGGIIGRTDDMIHVRGNNVYPSALEAVIRRFPEIAEFRMELDQSGPLPELRVQVEPVLGGREVDLAERVARAIRDELLFRVEVATVPPGSLPRFEMKARRLSRGPK